MHTKSTTELISMAQAVLVSLIESHKVIDPCEVENTLVAINSFLIDASISSSRSSVTNKGSIALNNNKARPSLPSENNQTQSDPLFAPYDGGMTIAFRIQLARENLGLTEADLARKLNTYSDHISDWECGTTEPPASMIIPLANALKCDPLWLLTGEITPQASSDNVAQQHHRASQQAGGVSREVLRQ